MRTRIAPNWRVRHRAVPASALCSVGSMVLQSVVPNGMSVSSMVVEAVWLANTDAGCLADDSVLALGCHQHVNALSAYLPLVYLHI